MRVPDPDEPFIDPGDCTVDLYVLDDSFVLVHSSKHAIEISFKNFEIVRKGEPTSCGS